MALIYDLQKYKERRQLEDMHTNLIIVEMELYELTMPEAEDIEECSKMQYIVTEKADEIRFLENRIKELKKAGIKQVSSF